MPSALKQCLNDGFEIVTPKVEGDDTPTLENAVLDDDTEIVLVSVPEGLDVSAMTGITLDTGKIRSFMHDEATYEIEASDMHTSVVNAFPSEDTDAYQIGKPFAASFIVRAVGLAADMHGEPKPIKQAGVTHHENLVVRSQLPGME